MSTRQHLLLSACGAGLSCAAALSGGVIHPPAAAANAGVTNAMDQLGGTKAAGSSKSSPFAAAKESDSSANEHLRAQRGRLWWLLLPVGLAAISYGALRSQESPTDA